MTSIDDMTDEQLADRLATLKQEVVDIKLQLEDDDGSDSGWLVRARKALIIKRHAEAQCANLMARRKRAATSGRHRAEALAAQDRAHALKMERIAAASREDPSDGQRFVAAARKVLDRDTYLRIWEVANG